jgi:hypothetical protein
MIQVFIPAPDLPPVRKRKTKKLQEQNPFLNSNQRRHRMTEAKITALWKAEAAAAFEGLPPMGKVRIRADVWRDHNGRLDPGNVYPSAKACVDGIVAAGVLVDDSFEYVIGPDMRIGGKGDPGLMLTVTEISEENTEQTVHSCPSCGTIVSTDTKAAPQERDRPTRKASSEP